ncbi:MAG: protein-tyrosine phosphatase family protein [Tepidiformaceae bacterium]
MPNWVIEGVLATSPRPGYRPGPEQQVPVEVVDEWLEDARTFGIRSVICLIGGDQLWLYRKSLPEGLLARYRSAGLEAFHIPTEDQQTHPFTESQYEAAWEAFESLPKPVLVHCSAGMDRTGRIVDLIVARRSNHAHVKSSEL